MSSQKTNLPQLQAGEQIILQGRGAYKENLRSGWKVAQFFLTDQRFIIYQRPAIRFESALGDIKDLSVEKLHYVIRKRESLSLSYKARTGSRDGRIWFVANDLESWRGKIISQAALLKVDLGVIEEISAQLDSDSQDILWYMWENRHARINQLADLIDAPNHMHVLMTIRDTINPVGQKVVGCPILSFERSKMDPETGEVISFSWWLVGHQEKCVPSEERLVDILDEGDYVRVIMEVRGVDISDIRLDYDKDRLMVRSHKIGASLRQKMDLPYEVSPEGYDMYIRNNFLEIRLNKVQ